jgi:hypothetical protein
VSKRLFATGRYCGGLWRIESEAGVSTYVVQVMEAGRAQTALTTTSRYEAMSVYNMLTAPQRWVLEVHGTGGRIVRSTDEDGEAAGFAARNQKEGAV